jgi:hypothetical protein
MKIIGRLKLQKITTSKENVSLDKHKELEITSEVAKYQVFILSRDLEKVWRWLNVLPFGFFGRNLAM